jgi:hypothetical protein
MKITTKHLSQIVAKIILIGLAFGLKSWMGFEDAAIILLAAIYLSIPARE